MTVDLFIQSVRDVLVPLTNTERASGMRACMREHEAMLAALESRDGKKLSVILRNPLAGKTQSATGFRTDRDHTPQP